MDNGEVRFLRYAKGCMAIKRGWADPDKFNLEDFRTANRYLSQLAEKNSSIENPLDEKAVTAYFVGNEFSETKAPAPGPGEEIEPRISWHNDYVYLMRELHLKKEIPSYWKKCLVYCGEVTGKPAFDKKAKIYTVSVHTPHGIRTARLDDEYQSEKISKGDLVSIHWGNLVEKISQEDFRSYLELINKYTPDILNEKFNRELLEKFSV